MPIALMTWSVVTVLNNHSMLSFNTGNSLSSQFFNAIRCTRITNGHKISNTLLHLPQTVVENIYILRFASDYHHSRFIIGIDRNRMGCTAATPTDQNSLSSATLSRIYERKELIGKGTYGEVYRCINRLNQQQYALKVVKITAKNRKQAESQVGNLKREIGVLKKLNHPNIVKYHSFDIGEEEKHVQIVLEYAQKGSLKELVERNGPLTQWYTVLMVRQILEGLAYLHSKNIAHRDLKCANILVMADDTLKITDFGTAKQLNIGSTEDIAKASASLKGTPYYMAPEVLKRTGHTVSADIWSLGCLVIQMLTGKAPWTSLTTDFEQIISYIVSGIHPPFPTTLSEQCQCFLQSCTDPVPNQRLTAEQLLKHRWIDKKVKQLDRPTQDTHYRKQSAPEVYNNDIEQVEVIDIPARITQPSLKELKRQEIDTYINQKNQRNMSSKTRSSAKGKKLKGSKDIKYPNLKTSEGQGQIQVIPHQPPLPKIKTAPQTKTPEAVIANLHNWDETDLRPQGQTFSRQTTTRIKTEQSVSNQLVIDTAIAREERNRYLEAEQKLREQRQFQKQKWERELKQGANYLRNEISQGYQV